MGGILGCEKTPHGTKVVKIRGWPRGKSDSQTSSPIRSFLGATRKKKSGQVVAIVSRENYLGLIKKGAGERTGKCGQGRAYLLLAGLERVITSGDNLGER